MSSIFLLDVKSSEISTRHLKPGVPLRTANKIEKSVIKLPRLFENNGGVSKRVHEMDDGIIESCVFCLEKGEINNEEDYDNSAIQNLENIYKY